MISRVHRTKLSYSRWPFLLCLGWCLGTAGCGGGDDASDEETPEYQVPPFHSTGLPPADPSFANAYSWDGSWNPAPSEFPIDGMFDETHPTLPPGTWGWDNECDCPGDEGLAIYENEFVDRGVDFEALADGEGRVFGWRMISLDGSAVEMDHRADNWEGCPGVDIFDLAPGGDLSSTAGINPGEGPDMLRYATGASVDLRTGSDTRGALFDNDLVILGSDNVLPLNTYDISGTTVHTGPGSDLVFIRNFGPAAIDLGNGLAGRTDTTDLADGDDMVILQGNMRDFRVYGGYGNDVVVWYVDEVLDDRWLGPNFFGGGGWGDAIFGDPGTDRLILVIPQDTEIVTARADHDDHPGTFLAFIYADYAESIDTPTADDVHARYYGIAPPGPAGEKTLTLSYRSADGAVFTHDFYMTAFEELQLGAGGDAVVCRVDDVEGTVTPDATLAPMTDIPQRSAFNELFDTFAR